MANRLICPLVDVGHRVVNKIVQASPGVSIKRREVPYEPTREARVELEIAIPHDARSRRTRCRDLATLLRASGGVSPLRGVPVPPGDDETSYDCPANR